MKNMKNSLGYLGFEFGATVVLGEFSFHSKGLLKASLTEVAAGSKPRSSSAALPLLCSGLVILTTLHAQDFAGIEGDRALGRRSFPVRSPQLSRACVYMDVALWSFLLACAWSMTWMGFLGLGLVVARRFCSFLSIVEGQRSDVPHNSCAGEDDRFIL
ncbi:uncharacterized protein SCHCODRAFT_02693351 [Schizophyllum commune H4-8]|nr:uncharacterized protein SCHCODRAFT_02693351 [Schizophyllum commune H4-8]KAI5886656.1 hypothetical protein SCHCODRAFT_02693351 [Schizophyllum commune H4-8]